MERYTASFQAEIKAFIQSIRNHTPPPVSGQDGRAALVLALASEQSRRTGLPVKIHTI
jgi:myo-inositol 2-dehydrogenase/D-chiro-inositol 1-dehydrogenase